MIASSKRTDASHAEPKAKPATYGSLAHKRSNDNLDINENKHTVHLDYNPNSGVTFRENRNSDVQVVGRGYNDDNSVYESRATQQANTRARDRRRANKGEGGGPLCQWRRCLALAHVFVLFPLVSQNPSEIGSGIIA